jgi:hypothetical protein
LKLEAVGAAQHVRYDNPDLVLWNSCKVQVAAELAYERR